MHTRMQRYSREDLWKRKGNIQARRQSILEDSTFFSHMARYNENEMCAFTTDPVRKAQNIPGTLSCAGMGPNIPPMGFHVLQRLLPAKDEARHFDHIR